MWPVGLEHIGSRGRKQPRQPFHYSPLVTPHQVLRRGSVEFIKFQAFMEGMRQAPSLDEDFVPKPGLRCQRVLELVSIGQRESLNHVTPDSCGQPIRSSTAVSVYSGVPEVYDTSLRRRAGASLGPGRWRLCITSALAAAPA